MLDIKFIIANPEKIKDAIKYKNISLDYDSLLEIYSKVKQKRQEIERLNKKSNETSKLIKSSDPSDRDEIIELGKKIKKQISNERSILNGLEDKYNKLMLKVPNIYSDDSPIGKDDTDNISIRKYLEPTSFNFTPLNHLELGKKLDILDFDLGTKVTGRKFYFWKGKGAILELSLIRFAIDIATRYGYVPILTPDLAKNSIIVGSGFTPRGPETQIYSIEDTDISLIGTAEITLGGMLSDTVLNYDDLPIKYAGYSHCFRTEAGSYGRESQGLYRVHQFSKVELYQFVDEDLSEKALEEILEVEEEIYKSLEIPYQVVSICTGDLGAPAFKKYDIEAWMPCKGESGGYGEITSVSNCTDFQSRRLNIRYKNPKTKKNSYVHTLNGTALALSRVPVAIIENFQNKDGNIRIPKALRPYTGFDII
jgi:seryl-tRNA synthetase